MKKFNKDRRNCLAGLQSLYQSFDPVVSINSGQVFLWEKRGDSWYGIHGDRVVRFTKADGQIEFTAFPEDRSCEQKMFRLGDDIRTIFTEMSSDPLVRRLIRTYPGLRLMRQEANQCLFSFLCASNTNIPTIRRMLHALTRKLGRPVKVDDVEFFTFPSAADINRVSIDELRACGLGYRAKAIKAAAGTIASGQIDFDALKTARYEEAKKELLKVYGVGSKIADCVLLFSLEKLDAFPIDVWIARALAGHYRWLHKKKFGEKITPHQYEQLSGSVRDYFGRYAGYSQQYLYYHMRQAAGKKW
ncbi:MAG TPA: DNA glycosylase [Nitrososphaera sp.]